MEDNAAKNRTQHERKGEAVHESGVECSLLEWGNFKQVGSITDHPAAPNEAIYKEGGSDSCKHSRGSERGRSALCTFEEQNRNWRK